MSEEKRKGKLWKCPVCGNSGKLSSRRKRGLQFYKSRCCQVCNTIWNPGFDRLSAFIIILIGFIFALICFKLFLFGIDEVGIITHEGDTVGYRFPIVALLGLIIGSSLVIYGIAVFAGKAGKVTIIQQGAKKE